MAFQNCVLKSIKFLNYQNYTYDMGLCIYDEMKVGCAKIVSLFVLSDYSISS
jgi:hypothetical protein